jgi:hypothetical protein
MREGEHGLAERRQVQGIQKRCKKETSAKNMKCFGEYITAFEKVFQAREIKEKACGTKGESG